MSFFIEVSQFDEPKFRVDTAEYWRVKRGLDAASTFETSIPATDDKAYDILEEMTLSCMEIINGVRIESSTGTVGLIEESYNDDGTVSFVFSGKLVEIELRKPSMGYLELKLYENGEDVPMKLSDAISVIMAGAPDGFSWRVIDGGDIDIFASLAGESLLKSLVKIAEHTGSHFRFDNKELVWFVSPQETQIRATNAPATSYGVSRERLTAIIESVDIKRSSSDLVTRIYPYGSGGGDVRTSLRYVDADIIQAITDAGYEIDSDENYIENTAATQSYGYIKNSQRKPIEKYLEWKEIGPIGGSESALKYASNYLAGTAFEWLKENSKPTEVLDVKIMGIQRVIYPGQTLRIDFRGLVGGRIRRSINKDMVVVSATIEWTSDGVKTIGIEVSEELERPKNGLDQIVSEIEQAKFYSARPQESVGKWVEPLGELPVDNSQGQSATIKRRYGFEVREIIKAVLRVRSKRFYGYAKPRTDFHEGDTPDKPISGGVLGNANKPLSNTNSVSLSTGATLSNNASLTGSPTVSGDITVTSDITGKPQGGDVISGGRHRHTAVMYDGKSPLMSNDFPVRAARIISGSSFRWYMYVDTGNSGSLLASNEAFVTDDSGDHEHTTPEKPGLPLQNATVDTQGFDISLDNVVVDLSNVAIDLSAVTVDLSGVTIDISHQHDIRHDHQVQYGLFQDSLYPGLVSVRVNGQNVLTGLGSSGVAFDTEVDISSLLKLREQDNTIEFIANQSDSRGLIVASLEITAIQSTVSLGG